MESSVLIWITIGLLTVLATLWVMNRRRTKTIWKIIELIQQFVDTDQTAEPEQFAAIKRQLIELHRKHRKWFAAGFAHCYFEVFSAYETAKTARDNAQAWPGVPRHEISHAEGNLTAETRRLNAYLALNDVFNQIIVNTNRPTPHTS